MVDNPLRSLPIATEQDRRKERAFSLVDQIQRGNLRTEELDDQDRTLVEEQVGRRAQPQTGSLRLDLNRPAPRSETSPVRREDINLNRPIDTRQATLEGERAERSTFEQGLRSGVLGVQAGARGAEAIVQGLASPVIGEEAAQRTALETRNIQERAAEVGPQTSFEDVLGGTGSFSEFLVGGIGQQVPNLALTIGASLIGGPVAGAATRAGATRLATATASQAQRALGAGAARTGAARAALAEKQKLFKEALNAGATTQARQRSVETAAAARNLTAQQGAEQALRQQAKDLLENVIKRRNTAFARGTEVGGVLTGSAAGSGVAAGEAASFILDPESDNTLVERSTAALFGAAGEGLTNALPILGVLRNVGLGRTAGTFATQNLARRLGGSRSAAVGIGAAKQSVAEGVQEVSAEFIMQAAHRTINENIELLDDEALMRYLEAGVLGGIIGGGIGGATSFRLRAPGPNVQAQQERFAEAEKRAKREEFEALDPEVKAQRSANPLDRMNVAATAMIGRDVLQGTVAGRRARAELDPQQFERLQIDAALALRTLVDPDVDVTTRVREGTSLGEAARATAERVFGDELPVALEMARQTLLGAERTELDYARTNGMSEDAVELERRVNEIERLGSDELIEEEPAAAEDLGEVDPGFTLPLQREVDFRDIVPNARPLNSPRFGPIFPSARSATRQSSDPALLAQQDTIRQAEQRLATEPDLTREERAELEETIAEGNRVFEEGTSDTIERIAEQTGGEVRSVADIAERVIRRDLGLEPSTTLNQNDEARALLIREAQEISDRLPEGNRNRQEITNVDEARTFLNQFDTVVQERLPTALRGGDELAFSDAEVRVAPERKRDAAGEFINREQKFIVERRPKDGKPTEGQVLATTPDGKQATINLVEATSRMLGRINAQGTTQTAESQEQAGRRAQQEGGRTGGGFSNADKATALLAAAADLRDRGFQFELDPDALVFRGERTPTAEVKRINSEIEALQAERRSATPERAAELQQQIDELRGSIQQGLDQTVADLTENVSPELRRAIDALREAAQEPTGGVAQAAREVAAGAPTETVLSAQELDRQIAEVDEQLKLTTEDSAKRKELRNLRRSLQDRRERRGPKEVSPRPSRKKARQPESKKDKAARIDAKEKAKREERAAKREQLTQLQERLQRVADVTDNISARKRTEGGTRALLRDLRKEIAELDPQGDARRIEALQAVERFFALPENQQRTQLDTLKAKRAKLDEQVNATRAEIKKAEQFLRGTQMLRELNNLRGRPLFNQSADARAAALLREFVDAEKQAQVELRGESAIDVDLSEQPVEFGEIVNRTREDTLPAWLQRPDRQRKNILDLLQSGQLSELILKSGQLSQARMKRLARDARQRGDITLAGRMDMLVGTSSARVGERGTNPTVPKSVRDDIRHLERLLDKGKNKKAQRVRRHVAQVIDNLNNGNVSQAEPSALTRRVQNVHDWLTNELGLAFSADPDNELATPPTAQNLREEGDVLQALTDELGLDAVVRVVDWVEFAERANVSEQEMARSDGLVRLTRNKEGKTFATIWVNEALGAGTDARGAALYHELGHAVLTASTFKATDAEVKAIWKSYRTWVEKNKGRTVSEALTSRRALLNMVNTRADNTTQVKQLKPGERRELLDFQEWFADQTARFMETSKAARQTAAKAAQKAEQGSVVRRFFSNLATRLKRIKAALQRTGRPAQSVNDFLTRLMTAKGAASNVRQFDMWTRIEEAGNAVSLDAIEDLVNGLAKSGPASFAKSANVRAQRRLVQGAHEMATVPYSTEAFYATRDAVVAAMTPEERFIVARAFSTPAVRRQLLDVLREAGVESEAFLSDPLNLIAAGYQIWLSDNLKLGPKAGTVFSSLSKYAAELAGRVRTHEQAEQLLQAMAQNKINARRSRLHEAAQQGSHLNRGRYALDRGLLARAGEIQERFAKQDEPDVAKVREELDKDRDLKRLPSKIRNWLAQDIAAKTFSEKFVEDMTAYSDFTLDSSKQFELKRVLEKKGPLVSAANGIANLGKLLERSNFGRLILSEAQRARLSGNVAIESLLNDVYPDITTQGRGEAMLPRKTRRRSAFNNQYFDIVDDLTDAQQNELREAMLQRTPATDPAVKQAERKMRALMKRLRSYAVNADLEMGNIDNYFPWVFDPLKVEKQRKALMTRLTHKKYRADWEELARKRGLIDRRETLTDELRNQMIRATLDKIITLDGGLADTTERLHDPAPSVGALNKRELNFLWEKGDKDDRALISDIMSDDINGTMATYINQLVKRVEYVRTFGANGEEFQRRLQQARELGASYSDINLMQKMLQSAMGTIGLEVAPFWKKALEPLNRGLRRAPVVTKKGKPFASRTAAEKRLSEMKTGGTIIEVPGGYAIERNLTVNPRRFRQLQSAAVVYQNFRLLSLAALTNVADAAGILARTGDGQVAWEAYKQGVAEVWQAWGDRKLTPTEKRRRRSEQRKLAEEIGAIEASVISDQLGQFYGSVFMDGAAKRYNDALFKYNGMEGLTRVTRLMAVTAGRRYLSNHAARALDGEAQSVDMLRAIDLEPSDVRLDAKGELVFLSQDQLNDMLDPMELTAADVNEALKDTGRFTPEQLDVLREVARDDRVKRALFRMADESVLRPAATQRPTWMNDPNWLVFSHLKGFMYTYHERVLRRAYTSAAEGNWAPAAYMLSYVPVIMAADLVRQLLQHGPEGDDRKERWGLGDYALDALHRSGIGGAFNLVPDMMKTHSLGKNPLVELGGPTVSQMNDWMRSLGGTGSVTNTLKRTLPASQVLVDIPSAWTSYAFNDHIGQDNEIGRLARASAVSDMPLMNQGLLGDN